MRGKWKRAKRGQIWESGVGELPLEGLGQAGTGKGALWQRLGGRWWGVELVDRAAEQPRSRSTQGAPLVDGIRGRRSLVCRGGLLGCSVDPLLDARQKRRRNGPRAVGAVLVREGRWGASCAGLSGKVLGRCYRGCRCCSRSEER